MSIPYVDARESLGDKIKEANDIMNDLGTWQGEDPLTGFQLIKRSDGRILKVTDLVDDDAKREKVMNALRRSLAATVRDCLLVVIAAVALPHDLVVQAHDPTCQIHWLYFVEASIDASWHR